MSVPDPEPDRVEEYAGGELGVRRGIVNRWLLAVYALLALWGIYYLFRYWTVS
jgi:hypothetical protein